MGQENNVETDIQEAIEKSSGIVEQHRARIVNEVLKYCHSNTDERLLKLPAQQIGMAFIGRCDMFERYKRQCRQLERAGVLTFFDLLMRETCEMNSHVNPEAIRMKLVHIAATAVSAIEAFDTQHPTKKL